MTLCSIDSRQPSIAIARSLLRGGRGELFALVPANLFLIWHVVPKYVRHININT